MPFKCKIEVKYKGGEWVPKTAESTIFPKNWSKERIQEEVAFVYENSVVKGTGLDPNTVKNIFQKYKAMCSQGFEIVIEVDINKNIFNAYPFK